MSDLRPHKSLQPVEQRFSNYVVAGNIRQCVDQTISVNHCIVLLSCC